MTINEFVDVLRNPETAVVDAGSYYNEAGEEGYFAKLRLNGRFYAFSVSGTNVPFTPEEVASAITSPERNIQRESSYKTHEDTLEATIRVAGHSYMIGALTPPKRTYVKIDPSEFEGLE